MNEDIRTIEAATRTYLDGLYEGDVDKLATVFHSTMAMTQVVDGAIKVVGREQWFEMVRNRPSPRKAGLARGDHILTLDLCGPTLALVKVRCQMPPRYFTDLLSFLKVDGRWQVVQKVFMTEIGP